MAVFYLICGILFGTVGSLVAIIAGASPFLAGITYTVTGAVSLGFVSIRHLVLMDSARHGVHEAHEAPVCAPLKQPDPGMALDSRSVPAALNSKEMKILAVDDDAFILELIPKIASKVGCSDVTTASSGAQALDLLKNAVTPFDCILLDINMPVMDGIDLCRHMRGMADYREVPIIMLTAMSDIDYLDGAFRAGASDYTAKPFDIIELGGRLQAAQARMVAKRMNHSLEGSTGPEIVGASVLDETLANRLPPLPAVSALIQYPALENYLSQLSGSALTTSYVMAVVVDQLDSLIEHDAAETEMLMQVAKVIEAVCGVSRYLMAYTGFGQFVVVASSEILPNSAGIEAALQKRVDIRLGASGPKIMITVGEPVRPGFSRSRRARAACDSALALARDRIVGRTVTAQSRNDHSVL